MDIAGTIIKVLFKRERMTMNFLKKMKKRENKNKLFQRKTKDLRVI